jgi:Na+/H+ antiporter NhaD/arsenite permease-like protein
MRSVRGILLTALAPTAFVTTASAAEGGGEIGAHLPLASILPFVGILLSIALFPLIAPRFWHRHYPKVSLFWMLVFAVPFLIAYRGTALHQILHVYIADYMPFLLLIGSLFVASGGILLRGSPAGTPRVNTALLAVGTLLASWIGTTGAAILLIRPLLRANAHRRYRTHTVCFFIFLVANIGGALTPLGDPPLFLGFLHGVPFFWTLRLLPHTGLVSVGLLGAFYTLDSILHRREARSRPPTATPPGARPVPSPPAPREPLRIEGAGNLLCLAGILGAVLLSGLWRAGDVRILGVSRDVAGLARDGLLLAIALISLRITPGPTRAANDFTWGPIREVAVLFAGIFMTILPAIAILRAGPVGALGGLLASVERPGHYFWAAGGLSSFLDNAPTYLTFFNSELGKFYAGIPEREAVAALLREKPVFLEAISAGAVFMGANTYIGNAPNFMVRSIAEEAGVRMPSFFGYMLRYSIPFLIPLFALTTWIFFR